MPELSQKADFGAACCRCPLCTPKLTRTVKPSRLQWINLGDPLRPHRHRRTLAVLPVLAFALRVS